MAASDVRDILDIDPRSAVEALLARPVKKPTTSSYRKRPEGISRELWGLISDKDGHDVSLVPTEAPVNEYKRSKARIGKSSRVRKWRWVPFQNSARTDGATFYHYRRVGEPETEYAFAKFNKKLDLPAYSDDEYSRLLQSSEWSREETDYLWSMLAAFDLRWVVVHDRWRYGEADTDPTTNNLHVGVSGVRRETVWKSSSKPRRSVEDMKERFYAVCAALAKHRGVGIASSASTAPNQTTSTETSNSTTLPSALAEPSTSTDKQPPNEQDAGTANDEKPQQSAPSLPKDEQQVVTASSTAATNNEGEQRVQPKTNVEVTRWLDEVVAFPYDADHERKRKEQLDRLLNRTRVEEEEEEDLIVALKRIEQRRKDTEKELDKLMGAQPQPVAAPTIENPKPVPGRPIVHTHTHAHPHTHTAPSMSLGALALGDVNRKKQKQKMKKVGVTIQNEAEKTVAPPAATQRVFPDPDAKAAAGVSLQSHRQRCPASVAQKRVRAVEQVLTELGIDPNGVLSFREVVREYNELREDVLRLIELKLALGNAEYENTTLRHRYDKIAPRQAQRSDLPSVSETDAPQTPHTPAAPSSSAVSGAGTNAETRDEPPASNSTATDFGSPQRLVSDAVDVQSLHSTRKRRAPNSSPIGAPVSTSPNVLTRSHHTGGTATRGGSHMTGDEKMDAE